jgi:hypothetical protein
MASGSLSIDFSAQIRENSNIMDAPKLSVEAPKTNVTAVAEKAPNVVFLPQKLKEVVEIIDLMGTIASRVREDGASDPAAAGSSGGGKAQGATGTSTRDEAIANAPPVPVMQKKLIHHLEQEVRVIQRTARSLARSNKPGTAYLLTELYKKMRRLTTLVSTIIHASAEVIKRLYISAFIDRQALVVTGDGSLEGTQ